MVGCDARLLCYILMQVVVAMLRAMSSISTLLLPHLVTRTVVSTCPNNGAQYVGCMLAQMPDCIVLPSAAHLMTLWRHHATKEQDQILVVKVCRSIEARFESCD